MMIPKRVGDTVQIVHPSLGLMAGIVLHRDTANDSRLVVRAWSMVGSDFIVTVLPKHLAGKASPYWQDVQL